VSRWKTTPIAASASRLLAFRSKPHTAMRPAAGANNRVTSAISVVLPAPLGPSSAVNPPPGTANETPSSALAARV
jgi:hypothetical protein